MRRYYSDRTNVPVPTGEVMVLRLGKNRDPRLLERFNGGEIHLSAEDVTDLLDWLDRRGQKRQSA